MVLMTQHVYDPANALVTLGTLYCPKVVTVGTGVPFGPRIWKVVISAMFLVIQAIVNKSPSLTVASGKSGSLKAIGEVYIG